MDLNSLLVVGAILLRVVAELTSIALNIPHYGREETPTHSHSDKSTIHNHHNHRINNVDISTSH